MAIRWRRFSRSSDAKRDTKEKSRLPAGPSLAHVPELAFLLAFLAGILLLLAGLVPAALLLLAGFLPRIALTRILGLLARLLAGLPALLTRLVAALILLLLLVIILVGHLNSLFNMS